MVPQGPRCQAGDSGQPQKNYKQGHSVTWTRLHPGLQSHPLLSKGGQQD
jgi:hypothetical protein